MYIMDIVAIIILPWILLPSCTNNVVNDAIIICSLLDSQLISTCLYYG